MPQNGVWSGSTLFATHPAILYTFITRVSWWRNIAYPHASAITYLRAHQISKCIPPVLIQRAITCDSFKVLAQRSLGGVVWHSKKKKTPQVLFFDLWWPPDMPMWQNFCTTVFYSSLPLIWYATWLFCLYRMDFGPFWVTPRCPQGLHQNSECVPSVFILLKVSRF